MEYESTEAKRLVQLLETSESQEKEYWLRRTRRNIIIWSLVLVLLALVTTFVVLGLSESSRWVDFELHYVKSSEADGTSVNDHEDRKASLYENVNSIMPPEDTEGFNFTGDYYNSSNYDVVIDGESNIANSLTYEESIYMQYEMGYYKLTITTDSLSQDKFETSNNGVGYNKRLYIVPQVPYGTDSQTNKNTFLDKYTDFVTYDNLTYTDNHLYTLYTLYNCSVEKTSKGYNLLDIDGKSNAHIRGFHGTYKDHEVSYSFREVTIQEYGGTGTRQTTFLVTKRVDGVVVASNFSNNLRPKFVVDEITGKEDINNVLTSIDNGEEILYYERELYDNEENANEFYMPGRDMVFYIDWEADDRYMVLIDTMDEYTWNNVYKGLSTDSILTEYNLNYNIDSYFEKYGNDNESNDWDNLKTVFQGVYGDKDWSRAIVLNGIETDANITTFIGSNLREFSGNLIQKNSSSGEYYYPYAKEGYTFGGWQIYTMGVDGKYYWKDVKTDSKILSGADTTQMVEKHSETCIMVRPKWVADPYYIEFDKNNGEFKVGGDPVGYSVSGNRYRLQLAVDGSLTNSQGRAYTRKLIAGGSGDISVSRIGYDFVGWELKGKLLFNYSTYICTSCGVSCQCGYVTIGEDSSEKHIVVSSPRFSYGKINFTGSPEDLVKWGYVGNSNQKLWVYTTAIDGEIYNFYYFGTADQLNSGETSSMEIPLGYYSTANISATAVWNIVVYKATLNFNIDNKELEYDTVQGYNYLYGLASSYIPSAQHTGTWYGKTNTTYNGVEYTTGIVFTYDMFYHFSLPSPTQIYRRGYKLVGYNIAGKSIENGSQDYLFSDYGKDIIAINANSNITGCIIVKDVYDAITITPIWEAETYSVTYLGTTDRNAQIKTNIIYDNNKTSTDTHHIITMVADDNTAVVPHGSESTTYQFDSMFDNTMQFNQYQFNNDSAVMMVRLLDNFANSTFKLDIRFEYGYESVVLTKEDLASLFGVESGRRIGEYNATYYDNRYNRAKHILAELTISVVVINNVEEYFKFEFSGLATNVAIKLTEIDYDLVENTFATHNNAGNSNLADIESPTFVPANWYNISTFDQLKAIYKYNKTHIHKIHYVLVQADDNCAKYIVYDMLNIVGELPNNATLLLGGYLEENGDKTDLSNYFARVMTINMASNGAYISELDTGVNTLGYNNLSLIERGKISNALYVHGYSDITKSKPIIPSVEHTTFGTTFYSTKGITYQAKISVENAYTNLVHTWIESLKTEQDQRFVIEGINFTEFDGKESTSNYTTNSADQIVYKLANISLPAITINFGVGKKSDSEELVGDSALTYTILDGTKDKEIPEGIASYNMYSASVTDCVEENNALSAKFTPMSNFVMEIVFSGRFSQINSKSKKEQEEIIKELFTNLNFDEENGNAKLYVLGTAGSRKFYIQVFTSKLTNDNFTIVDDDKFVNVYIKGEEISKITNNYTLSLNNRFANIGYSFVDGAIVGGSNWITIESVESNIFAGDGFVGSSFTQTTILQSKQILTDGKNYTFKLTIGDNYFAYDDKILSVQGDSEATIIPLTDGYYELTLSAVSSDITITFQNVYRKVNNLTIASDTTIDGNNVYNSGVFVYNATFTNLIQITSGEKAFLLNGVEQELEDELNFKVDDINTIQDFFNKYFNILHSKIGDTLFTDSYVFEIKVEEDIYRFVTNGDMGINAIQNTNAISSGQISIQNNSADAKDCQAMATVPTYTDLDVAGYSYTFAVSADTNISITYTLKQVTGTFVIENNVAEGSAVWVVDYKTVIDNNLLTNLNSLNDNKFISFNGSNPTGGNFLYDSYLIIKLKALDSHNQGLNWVYSGLSQNQFVIGINDANINSNLRQYYYDESAGYKYYVIKLDTSSLSSANSFTLNILSPINTYSVTMDHVSGDAYLLEAYVTDDIDNATADNEHTLTDDVKINYGTAVTFRLTIKPGYNLEANYLRMMYGGSVVYHIGKISSSQDGGITDLTITSASDINDNYEQYCTYIFTITITQNTSFNFVVNAKETVKLHIPASTAMGINIDNISVTRPNEINNLSASLDAVSGFSKDENGKAILTYADNVTISFSPKAGYEKSQYTIKINDLEIFTFDTRTYIDSINEKISQEKLIYNDLLAVDKVEISEEWVDNKIVITITLTRITQNITLTITDTATNTYALTSNETLNNVELSGNAIDVSSIEENSADTLTFSINVDKSFSVEETLISLTLTRFDINGANKDSNKTGENKIESSGNFDLNSVYSNTITIDNKSMTIEYYIVSTGTDNHIYHFTIKGMYADLHVDINKKLEKYTIKLASDSVTYVDSVKVYTAVKDDKLQEITTVDGATVDLDYLMNTGIKVEHNGKIFFDFVIKPGFNFDYNVCSLSLGYGGWEYYDNIAKIDSYSDAKLIFGDANTTGGAHTHLPDKYTAIDGYNFGILLGNVTHNLDKKTVSLSEIFAPTSFTTTISGSSLDTYLEDSIPKNEIKQSLEYSNLAAGSTEYTYAVESAYNRSTIVANITLTGKDGSSEEITSATLTSEYVNYNGLGLSMKYTGSTIYIQWGQGCYYDIEIVLSGFETNVYYVEIDLSGDMLSQVVGDKTNVGYQYKTNNGALLIKAWYKEYSNVIYVLSISSTNVLFYNTEERAKNNVNDTNINVLDYENFGTSLAEQNVLTIIDCKFRIYYLHAYCMANFVFDYTDTDLVEGTLSDVSVASNTDITFQSNVYIQSYELKISSTASSRVSVYRNGDDDTAWISSSSLVSGQGYALNETDSIVVNYTLPAYIYAGSTTTAGKDAEGNDIIILNDDFVTILGTNNKFVCVGKSADNSVYYFALTIASVNDDINITFNENKASVDMFEYSTDFGVYSWAQANITYTDSVLTISKAIPVQNTIDTDLTFNVATIYIKLSNPYGYIKGEDSINYFNKDQVVCSGGWIEVPYGTNIVITITTDAAGTKAYYSNNNDEYINGVSLTENSGLSQIEDGSTTDYSVSYEKDFVSTNYSSPQLCMSIALNTYNISNKSKYTNVQVLKSVESGKQWLTEGDGDPNTNDTITIPYGTQVRLQYNVTSNMDFTDGDGDFSGTLAPDLITVNNPSDIAFTLDGSDYIHNLGGIDKDFTIVDNNKIATRFEFGYKDPTDVTKYIQVSYITIISNKELTFYDGMERGSTKYTIPPVTITNSGSGIQYTYLIDGSISSTSLYYSVAELTAEEIANGITYDISYQVSLTAVAGYEQALTYYADGNMYYPAIKVYGVAWGMNGETPGESVLTEDKWSYGGVYTDHGTISFGMYHNDSKMNTTGVCTKYLFDVVDEEMTLNTYTMQIELDAGINATTKEELTELAFTSLDASGADGNSKITSKDDSTKKYGVGFVYDQITTLEFAINPLFNQMAVFDFGGYTFKNVGGTWKIYSGTTEVKKESDTPNGYDTQQYYALTIGEKILYIQSFTVDLTNCLFTMECKIFDTISDTVTISSGDINAYTLTITSVGQVIKNSWEYKIINADGSVAKTVTNKDDGQTLDINFSGNNAIMLVLGQYLEITLHLKDEYYKLEDLKVSTASFIGGIGNNAELGAKYCVLYFKNNGDGTATIRVKDLKANDSFNIDYNDSAPKTYTMSVLQTNTDYGTLSMDSTNSGSYKTENGYDVYTYTYDTSVQLEYTIFAKYTQMRAAELKITTTSGSITETITVSQGNETMYSNAGNTNFSFSCYNNLLIIEFDSLVEDIDSIEFSVAEQNLYTATLYYMTSDYNIVEHKEMEYRHLEYSSGYYDSINEQKIRSLISGGLPDVAGLTFDKFVAFNTEQTYTAKDIVTTNNYLAGATGGTNDFNQNGLYIYATYSHDSITFGVTYDSDLGSSVLDTATLTLGQNYTFEATEQSARPWRYASAIQIDATLYPLQQDTSGSSFYKTWTAGTDEYVTLLQNIKALGDSNKALVIYTDAKLDISLDGIPTDANVTIFDMFAGTGDKVYLFEYGSNMWTDKSIDGNTYNSGDKYAIKLLIAGETHYLYLDKDNNYLLKLCRLATSTDVSNGLASNVDALIDVDITYPIIKDMLWNYSGVEVNNYMLTESSISYGDNKYTGQKTLGEFCQQLWINAGYDYDDVKYTTIADITITQIWSKQVQYEYRIEYNGKTYSTYTYVPFEDIEDFLNAEFYESGNKENKIDSNWFKEIMTCAYIMTDNNGAELVYYDNDDNENTELIRLIKNSVSAESRPQFTLLDLKDASGSAKVSETTINPDNSINYGAYLNADGSINYDKIKGNTEIKNARIDIIVQERGSINYHYYIGSNTAWRDILITLSGASKITQEDRVDLINDITLTSDEESLVGQLYTYGMNLNGKKSDTENYSITREGYNMPLFGKLGTGTNISYLDITGDVTELKTYSSNTLNWGNLAVEIDAGQYNNSDYTYTNTTLINHITLGILGESVESSVNELNAVGGLIANYNVDFYGGEYQNTISISNIINNYSITANAYYVAGIVGSTTDMLGLYSFDHNIRFADCVNNGDLTNTLENDNAFTVGLFNVGHVATISDSDSDGISLVNNGNITAKKGSIAGVIYANTISNAVSGLCNSGTIICEDGNICGVAKIDDIINSSTYIEGGTTYDYIIRNCYNNGDLLNENYNQSNNIIGVIDINGSIKDGTHIIRDCYNNGSIGSITGQYGMADVVGVLIVNQAIDGVVNCYNSGYISGYVVVGVVDICNSNSDDQYITIIEECYNTGAMNAFSGGVGVISSSSNISNIIGCYNTGKMNCTNYGIGVISSDAKIDSITNCYNTGEIYGGSTIEGYDNIVGVISSDAEIYSITNCYNTGDLTTGSKNTVGVVKAVTVLSVMTNCYNTGDISTTGEGNAVGVAHVSGYIDSIDNCYNMGDIMAGGIAIGVAYFGNKVINIEHLYNSGNIGYNNDTTTNSDGIYTNWDTAPNESTNEAYAIAYINENNYGSVNISNCFNGNVLLVNNNIVSVGIGEYVYNNIIGEKASMFYVNNTHFNGDVLKAGDVEFKSVSNYGANIYSNTAGAGIVIYETIDRNTSDEIGFDTGFDNKLMIYNGNNNCANVYSNDTAAGFMYVNGHVSFNATGSRGYTDIIGSCSNSGDIIATKFAAGVIVLNEDLDAARISSGTNFGNIKASYAAGVAVVKNANANMSITRFVECKNYGSISGDLAAGIGNGFCAVDAYKCQNLDNDITAEVEKITYNIIGAGLFITRAGAYIDGGNEIFTTVDVSGTNSIDTSVYNVTNNMAVEDNYEFANPTMTVGAGIVAVMMAEKAPFAGYLTQNTSIDLSNYAVYIDGVINNANIDNSGGAIAYHWNCANNWNYASGIAHITNASDYKDMSIYTDSTTGAVDYDAYRNDWKGVYINQSLNKSYVSGGTIAGIVTTSGCNREYNISNVKNEAILHANIASAGIIASMAEKDNNKANAVINFSNLVENDGAIYAETIDETLNSFAAGIACMIGDYELNFNSNNATVNNGNIYLGARGLIGAGIAYAYHISAIYKELLNKGSIYTRNEYDTQPKEGTNDYNIVKGSILSGGVVVDEWVEGDNWKLGEGKISHSGGYVGCSDSDYKTAAVAAWNFVVIKTSAFVLHSVGVDDVDQYHFADEYSSLLDNLGEYYADYGVFLDEHYMTIEYTFDTINPSA